MNKNGTPCRHLADCGWFCKIHQKKAKSAEPAAAVKPVMGICTCPYLDPEIGKHVQCDAETAGGFCDDHVQLAASYKMRHPVLADHFLLDPY